MRYAYILPIFLLLNIFQTSSCLGQWENKSDSSLVRTLVVSIAHLGNTIIMTDGGQGIDVSLDYGETWKPRPSSAKGYYIGIVSLETTIHLISDSGYFYSSDTGQTWNKIRSFDTLVVVNRSRFSTIKELNGNIVFGTIANGLFLSNDNGSGWNNKIPKAKIIAVGLGSKFYALTDKGLFRSVDKGQRWALVNDAIQNNSFSIFQSTIMDIRGALFIIGENDGKLFMSLNEGKDWTTIEVPQTFKREIACIDTIQDVIIIGTRESGCLISRNGGTEWFPYNQGLEVIDPVTNADNLDIYSLHNFGPYLLAGTYKGSGFLRRKAEDFKGIMYIGKGLMVSPYFADANYAWYKDGVLLKNKTEYKYTASKNGLFKVVITPASQSNQRVSSEVLTYTYLISDLEVTEVETEIIKENIDIFPNPSPGIFQVRSSNNSAYKITITDLHGRVVKEILSTQVAENNLNLSHEPKGLYILKIQCNENVVFSKVKLE